MFRRLLPLATAAALGLAGCAPAPIYRVAPGSLIVTPAQVSATPTPYLHQPVIWGGQVVSVSNFADHSEIEILGLPLDSSQRPRPQGGDGGRFIASFPGYVEAMNYPPGAFITVSGTLLGTRAGRVGAAPYTFPVVGADQSHLWTSEEMRSGHPNISFGVGVAGGFR